MASMNMARTPAALGRFVILVTLNSVVPAYVHAADEVESEWSGYLAVESRLFPHDALLAEQFDGTQTSLAVEPEYYRRWDDGHQSLTFKPFARLDQRDPERTHADIRELSWIIARQDWELRAGIRKVFWGVTETEHLVDIINQTDLVENIDGEDKLGQPMLDLALIRDWGNLDIFVLPGFRERTFPGRHGRLRSEPVVDSDLTRYESGAEDKHVDFAVRWFQTLGDWDIGLAHFHGTSREPMLNPALDTAGEPVLAPYYPLIDQTSLDLQATLESWLWKLEWITRAGMGDRYSAVTGGFEYTFVGVLDTPADIGLIGEYLFDDRNAASTTLFQDDVTVGLRLAMNDSQSTELLLGITIDRNDSRQRFYNLEASRRLGDRWKLGLEARLNSGLDTNSVFHSLHDDDYIQAELTCYF